MDFTSQEDIEAPIDRVFAVLTDFKTIERQAMRRGIKVQRTPPDTEIAQGMEWTAEFKFRGRGMTGGIKLDTLDPHDTLVFSGKAGGLDTELDITLTPLTPERTRMNLHAKLAPKTLSARLIVQSLKMAKARMTRKFSVKVAQFAKSIEDRARKAA